MTGIRWKAFCLAVMLSFASVASQAQEDLHYQKRANRYEGIRPKPVSGFDIELLSAQVDFADNPETLGERFHARFFLKQPGDVYLVVRELDYQHYYWLDKVVPKSPWQPGFGNVFDWSTADVVQAPRRSAHLGPGRGRTPRAREPERRRGGRASGVLPVPISHEGGRYVFRFRLREDAKVKGAIYKSRGASRCSRATWDGS